MKIEHKKNISWHIKNFEKYFMAHQYMPKIFNGPHKNPTALPPTNLMYGFLFLLLQNDDTGMSQ